MKRPSTQGLKQIAGVYLYGKESVRAPCKAFSIKHVQYTHTEETPLGCSFPLKCGHSGGFVLGYKQRPLSCVRYKTTDCDLASSHSDPGPFYRLSTKLDIHQDPWSVQQRTTVNCILLLWPSYTGRAPPREALKQRSTGLAKAWWEWRNLGSALVWGIYEGRRVADVNVKQWRQLTTHLSFLQHACLFRTKAQLQTHVAHSPDSSHFLWAEGLHWSVTM